MYSLSYGDCTKSYSQYSCRIDNTRLHSLAKPWKLLTLWLCGIIFIYLRRLKRQSLLLNWWKVLVSLLWLFMEGKATSFSRSTILHVHVWPRSTPTCHPKFDVHLLQTSWQLHHQLFQLRIENGTCVDIARCKRERQFERTENQTEFYFVFSFMAQARSARAINRRGKNEYP